MSIAKAPSDERAIVTDPIKIGSVLRGACSERTEAFFCGASFAVSLLVSLKSVDNLAIQIESASIADQRIRQGATCTLTFIHRGIQVVCTSLVQNVQSDLAGQSSIIGIAIPKFLAIRESRKQHRVEVRPDVNVVAAIWSFGRESTVDLSDISFDGARILLNLTQASVLKVGDDIEVAIDSVRANVRFKGRIRWIRDKDCGISFGALDWKTRAELGKIVDHCRSASQREKAA